MGSLPPTFGAAASTPCLYCSPPSLIVKLGSQRSIPLY